MTFRKNIRLAGFLLVFGMPFLAAAQEEAVCLACSREAWEGDSAAINKFISNCGIIDTVGYDSLDVVVKEKPVVKKVTMKLKSGRVLFSDSIYIVTEVMPQFKGGLEGMFTYLKENLKYPDAAKKQKISGMVMVEFVVERDGTVKHAHVLRGIGYGCDEEALRVVKGMKEWTAGSKKNKKVRVQMILPVRFSMD